MRRTLLGFGLLSLGCNDVGLPNAAIGLDRSSMPAAAPTPALPETAPAPIDAAASAEQAAPSTAERKDPASRGSNAIERMSSGDVRREIRPQLGAAKLAHAVFRTSFGPSAVTAEPASLVLTQSSDAPTQFGGFVLSGEVRYELPALHETWSGWDIPAVLFANVDDDDDREVIVLARFIAGVGPTASEVFHSNVVLDWDAERSAFVRLARVEGELESFPTAATVRAHLRSIVTPR